MNSMEEKRIDALDAKVSKIVRELYPEDYKPGLKHVSIAAREWAACLDIKMKIAKYGHGFVSDEPILRGEVSEACRFYDLRNSLQAFAKSRPDCEATKALLKTVEIFNAARLGQAPIAEVRKL